MKMKTHNLLKDILYASEEKPDNHLKVVNVYLSHNKHFVYLKVAGVLSSLTATLFPVCFKM